ncbi:hypothetical protein [Exiguobacterium sp. CH10]|uniref:hypothetical protein n=1 Tax=Exiguobacterium sp. CH10 TaxID=2751261 RepID=UPI001BE717C5|nr:hypothetical protein [Exiguobacterium sp. CH10]
MEEQFAILKDLSEYRTPTEMKSYFEEVIQALKDDRMALEISRLRIGKFKEFQEEFVPAYVFSLSPYFPKDAKAKVIIGNQNYDFVLLYPNGTEEKFEVSSYINGPREVEIARALNEHGMWSSRLKSYEQLKKQATTYIEETKKNMLKKSKKDYTHASLLFEVSTFEFSVIFHNEFDTSLLDLANFMYDTPFKAKHVYLIIQNGDDIPTVASNIIKVK